MMGLRLLALTIIALVIAVIETTACQDTEQVNKPDLIIESICYRPAPPSKDQFGAPVMGPGKSLNYTLRLKNIGNAAVTEFFYIVNTRSNEAFKENYYDSGHIFNHLGDQRIEPGEVLEATITDYVDEDVKRVRFLIDTEGKPLKPKGLVQPRLEESNYKNNTYELEFTPYVAHQVTNVGDKAFTVSWFSEVAELGYVDYGTSADRLDKTAYDDRGKSTREINHHISIIGLSANTTYYYQIVSGGVTYRDYCGLIYEITTGPTLEPQIPEMIGGKGYVTAAKDAIVYVFIQAGASQKLSAILDKDGVWSVDISQIRTSDYQRYYTHSDSDRIIINGWTHSGGGTGGPSWAVTIAEAKAAAIVDW